MGHRKRLQRHKKISLSHAQGMRIYFLFSFSLSLPLPLSNLSPLGTVWPHTSSALAIVTMTILCAPARVTSFTSISGISSEIIKRNLGSNERERRLSSLRSTQMSLAAEKGNISQILWSYVVALIISSALNQTSSSTCSN